MKTRMLLCIALCALVGWACAPANAGPGILVGELVSQVGAGIWIPNDSSEWDNGLALWYQGQKGRGAIRLMLGGARDGTIEDLGQFTIGEIALELRVKPLSEPRRRYKDSDWYAGVGLAYANMSKDVGGIEISDSALCPVVSLGFRSGSVSLDFHKYWGEDTVDIGGMTIGASYCW